MPYVANVYQLPPGTAGTPNTTIESAKYNTFINDITTAQNTARPILGGGTGGQTAVAGNDGLNTQGANMASGSTTDLAAATGVYLSILGTTTINSFGTVPSGALRQLTFTGILTITYNATSMILPGAANITTAVGDTATFRSLGGGNWRCVEYLRASGQALITSASAGSASAPSYSFIGDPDTGMYSYAANEIGFATTGVFRANLTASGFNIGRALADPTVAGVSLGVDGQSISAVSADTAWILNRLTSDGTIVQFRRQNVTVGTIAVTGTATAYNTSSDKRLKSELREFDSGAILDALAFGEFTWLADGSQGHGVLAQDAEGVYPEAISQDGSGFYVADYSKFVPVIGAETKALRQRVAQLEEMVERLVKQTS